MMLFLVLSAALSCICFLLGNANADEKPIDHAKRQIDWIVSNGGFYSPKLEFRRLSPEDPTSPSGLFASRDISKGEVLIVLPRKLFVTSDVDGTGEESEDTCDTVKNLIKQYKLGEESAYWPYVSYVMDDRHKGDLPCDWSDDGKELLESIIPHELLPRLDATEIWYEEDCDVDEDDVGPLEQFAYLSVLRRSWDDIMLPVVDMINHRNGRWRNVETNSAHEGKDIQLYALRDIAADEQLHLSYNECTDCCCYANTYVLPNIMKDYGFVEQYPQRWNFDHSWLNFEVDEVSNDGDNVSSAGASKPQELKVTWLSEEKPDFEDKYVLHGHLARLNNMRPEVNAKADALVSEHERSVIIGFYNALITALDLAIVSAGSGDTDNDDADSDVCAKGDDSETCSVSSRKYDNLEERPYEVFYMDEVCNFAEANEARDRNRYQEVAVYKSHYQTLSYYHSQEDDDTCLNLNGHQEVCTSVRPHYHELMVHYAAGFVENVERVMVLGGGDNMVLHEVLKYDSLKLAVILELDQTVARSAFEHFGAHPRWNDERVEWYFGDAAKSIPMLPREYYGSFDIVLIDLQTDIIEMLGIMTIASTLTKPDGIIVRNEDFGFGTTEAFAKHTVDLYNAWIPMFCVQGLTMGSNNVDVLMQPWKSHENISTLYFRPDEANKFVFWHSYRKNDNICNESEGANNVENGVSSDVYAQTSASGILMIIEVEDIVVDLNLSAAVETIISSAIKEAGLTKLSTKAFVSSNEEGGAYVLVYILQEGYVVARVWPERKFIALDLLLWGHFDKQDDAKARILKALGNSSDAEKASSSSYRIVTGGMLGTKTWSEDADKVGPPLHKSNLCSVSTFETESRDNPITQDDTDNVLIEGISLVQSRDDATGGVIAVICGDKNGHCRAQDVLAKAGASVMPVWTCPTLQDDANDIDLVRMYGCEMETLMRLREIASVADGNGEISGIVIDQGLPFAMGQILHKIFSIAGQRKELLSSEYVVIETSLITDANGSTSASWRRALLDMFRTDFVQFSPAYCAEVFFHSNSKGKGLELGVFSTGDEAFFEHLVAVIENIEATTNLAPDVRYVKNGVNNYLAEFKPKEKFTDSDYKEIDPDKSKKAHYLMGGQSNFQFQSSIDDEDEDQVSISCVRIKDALQRSLTLMNWAGMDSADIEEYQDNAKMGEGCVVVALWSGGNAVMLWDGQTGVDLNVFTNSESIEVHDTFADNLMKYIPSLKLGLRDDQPRGVGAS